MREKNMKFLTTHKTKKIAVIQKLFKSKSYLSKNLPTYYNKNLLVKEIKKSFITAIFLRIKKNMRVFMILKIV